MPEAEVVIAEVKKIKEGTSQKGPWTLWSVTDGNGTRYSTFKKNQSDLAETLIGKRAKIEYEETERGNNIKELAGPLSETNGDTPPLGTGDYVKAQTAPSDKRSIAASVALKAAVDTLAHTFTAESTAKNITNKVEPLANAYLMALLAMAADPPPEDYTKDGEDLPF